MVKFEGLRCIWGKKTSESLVERECSIAGIKSRNARAIPSIGYDYFCQHMSKREEAPTPSLSTTEQNADAVPITFFASNLPQRQGPDHDGRRDGVTDGKGGKEGATTPASGTSPEWMT